MCDEAAALFEKIAENTTCTLKKVDVRASSELYHLYGARIPVLYREDIHSELHWPFDLFQLGEFLR